MTWIRRCPVSSARSVEKFRIWKSENGVMLFPHTNSRLYLGTLSHLSCHCIIGPPYFRSGRTEYFGNIRSPGPYISEIFGPPDHIFPKYSVRLGNIWSPSISHRLKAQNIAIALGYGIAVYGMPFHPNEIGLWSYRRTTIRLKGSAAKAIQSIERECK